MAAVTPTAVRNAGPIGMETLLVSTFPGTVNDGDTWASGLGTRVVDFWSQDTDNPTTQGSVGVAAQNSSGTFTFFPAENAKSFFFFTRVSGS